MTARSVRITGIFAALAEFERELIAERTIAGLASARARGRKGGRPFKMTAAKLRLARTWFRGFRRTRPFWGGLWMLLGGWWILRMSMVEWQVLFSAGLTGFGGWLSGGGLILCGVVAWFAPSQSYFAGLIGLLLAVASFIISNLGGFFVGMFFGIVGSAMVLSWGERKARVHLFGRRKAATETSTDSGDASGDASESSE